MSKMPPVPPEQRSNKGPGSDPNVVVEEKIPGRENFDTQAVTATSSKTRPTKVTSRIDDAKQEP